MSKASFQSGLVAGLVSATRFPLMVSIPAINTLSYLGVITPPNVGGNNAASATVGGYAVFAGGENSSMKFSAVSAYDAEYVLYLPTSLRAARGSLAGVSPKGYALFVGGSRSNGPSNYADAYDDDLTRVAGDSLGTSRSSLAGATAHGCGFINGGYSSSFVSDHLSLTDVYDENLTRRAITGTRTDRRNHAGAATGEYAIFAGGTVARDGTGKSVTADAYNADFTRTNAADMSAAKTNFTGTSAVRRALFGGGYGPSGSVPIDTVEVYDDDLTRVTVYLSQALMMTCGGSLGQYTLFVGGYNGTGMVKTVDIFDAELNRTMGDPVSVDTNSFKSATVGNHLFFCAPNKAVTEVYKLV